MMRKYIFSLFLLVSCQSNPNIEANQQLIGAWINQFNDDMKIEFTKDGYFHRIIKGEKFEYKIFEELPNGEYEERDYGNLKYRIRQINNDSLECTFIGSKNGLEFSKEILILSDNHLIEVSYKSLPGIESHIDEMAYYAKEGFDSKTAKSKKVEKIIIPQGCNKAIYIAYNQNDGQEALFDSLGNRILTIPANGILKTRFKEDLDIVASQQYEFYEKDAITGRLFRMKEYQYGDYIKDMGAILGGKKAIKLKYPSESVAVFVEGFNQAPRTFLENEVFKEKISGNVMMFEIDTVRKKTVPR